MGKRPGTVRPVILSGGAGTRLWPMSRSLYPKQLLALTSERTLLQETATRVGAGTGFPSPIVVCNDEHRFVTGEQLREIGVVPQTLVLEPVGRNTAPAVAVAALLAMTEEPEALLLVLPSDHAVRDPGRFHAAVATAAAAAARDALVTFGVTPTAAETGYGYIRRGAPFEAVDGCFQVAQFVEKPDPETAARYLAAGDYYWNSGIFLLPAAAFLAELESFEPAIAAASRSAVEGARSDMDFLRLEEAAFARAPAKSIDYAVMEHTARAAVVPVEMGWSDVGSWSALWRIGDKDSSGNVLVGDVAAEGLQGCYVHTTGPMVAAVGLKDAVLVVTEDAVLAVARDRTEDVKAVVQRLTQEGRSEPVAAARVYRPWGFYQTIDTGERFQAKRITVNPGARLSLQSHRHRAEHWVVVSGAARVTRGDDVFDLGANESTYIPAGTRHRLENPGALPLRLIEVQSGDYLGEDDIVRYEDSYGRE